MNDAFRWNQWNLDHIAEHGILPEEAEYVVTTASRHYPQKVGNGKWLVLGQTQTGFYLHVIFVI